MFNTITIKDILINEIICNNIKNTEYSCKNGDEYVEIKNALFEVDKDYIFDNIESFVDDKWYIDNYDPILLKNDQYNKCINKLLYNPSSRQAVIIMGDVSEYDNETEFICTMYMHVFLDYDKNKDIYYLEYIVHMRSNDAIEFQSDIKWHNKIYDRIYNDLSKKYNNIIKRNIIWNADTFHLYKKYFKDVLI